MSTAPAPAGKPVKPSKGSAPYVKATPEDAPKRAFKISDGTNVRGQRIGIYGPGGIGKSSLVALLSDVDLAPVFLDVEDGSRFIDALKIEPIPETFEELLDAIPIAAEMGDAVVIDSLTKAEEMAVAHTLATVPHEKGHYVTSIEGYGFGKGYMHVYETFLHLLQALDTVVRQGKHVIVTMHDCTANVPNPAGEDWIRYEPRLQSPPSGKGSIRHRVKEWLDHLCYVGWDTFVNEDGKAKGSGTRTIFVSELPTWWAKSRLLSDPISYVQGDAELWRQLFEV